MILITEERGSPVIVSNVQSAEEGERKEGGEAEGKREGRQEERDTREELIIIIIILIPFLNQFL